MSDEQLDGLVGNDTLVNPYRVKEKIGSINILSGADLLDAGRTKKSLALTVLKQTQEYFPILLKRIWYSAICRFELTTPVAAAPNTCWI